MRGVLVLTMALVLTTSLTACGKQGPLRLPMTGSFASRFIKQGDQIMDHFTYKDGALYAEDVAIAEIAEAVGTPFLLLFLCDPDTAFFRPWMRRFWRRPYSTKG